MGLGLGNPCLLFPSTKYICRQEVFEKAVREGTHTRNDAPAQVRELVVADGTELFLILPLLRGLLRSLGCSRRLLVLRVTCGDVSTLSFSMLVLLSSASLAGLSIYTTAVVLRGKTMVSATGHYSPAKVPPLNRQGRDVSPPWSRVEGRHGGAAHRNNTRATPVLMCAKKCNAGAMRTVAFMVCANQLNRLRLGPACVFFSETR